MRSWVLLLGALLVATPAMAQDMDDDADRSVEGGGELLAGWEGRTDRGQPFDDVRFIETMGMYEISVGPAIVVWRPEDRARGQYSVTTTVHQISSKGHAHGAGLIIGSRDGLGPNQQYTYFLVRGDGAFIVKTRDGDSTANVSDGWEMHDAINQDGGGGEASNEMTIRVGAETTSFMLNGTEVFSAPTSELHTAGNYGYRLNHNLDMRFTPIEMGGM